MRNYLGLVRFVPNLHVIFHLRNPEDTSKSGYVSVHVVGFPCLDTLSIFPSFVKLGAVVLCKFQTGCRVVDGGVECLTLWKL